MHKLVVASARQGAGKTSLIVGLGRVLDRPFAYMKPFGDRLLYRKKRLWDYDSALIANIFRLTEEPQAMSIGFDHSKLRFMFDQTATQAKLQEMLMQFAAGKELVLIESGKDLSYGISVHLDCVSLARYADAALVVIVSGEEDAILDDVTFLRQRVDLAGVRLAGVIANRVQDAEDFRNTYQRMLSELDVQLLGVIPYRAELTYPSVRFLSEALFAKVLAGDEGLDRTVQHIFVGAMAADAARRQPRFGSERKLVITSGDRSDMILAALDGDTVAIVLTNNLAPPTNIISHAAQRGVPLLLVAEDTYQVAKQIDDTEYLLTRDEGEKIDLLTRLVREHVDLAALTGTGPRGAA